MIDGRRCLGSGGVPPRRDPLLDFRGKYRRLHMA